MSRPAAARLLATALLLTSAAAHADDTTWTLRGYGAVSGRLWANAKPGQEDNSAGLRLAPEWTGNRGQERIVFAPIVIQETEGTGRSRADVDELSFARPIGEGNLKLGIYRVFWGAAESRHLVDIINPPDYALHYAGDRHLATAILEWSQPTPLGHLDALLLPWERDPNFPGPRGRPRTELPVQEDQSHPDGRPPAWALRLSLPGSAMDAHVHVFQGLDREAVLTPVLRPAAPPQEMTASRQLVRQWGIDAQIPLDNWLIKGELIRRSGYSRPFTAGVLGVEYSFNSVAGSSADVALMAEAQYDARPADAPLPFLRHGVFTGLRLALNDAASTELKAGLLAETDGPARMGRIEASRRLADQWTIEASLHSFSKVTGNPALAGYVRDNFVEFVIKRHWP